MDEDGNDEDGQDDKVLIFEKCPRASFGTGMTIFGTRSEKQDVRGRRF